MAHLAVIDTNVLVAALLSKHSDAATVQVMARLFEGEIIPVYNEEIIAEYDEVLHRDKFHFPESQIRAFIDAIFQNGVRTMRLNTGMQLPDPKDLVFYEVVLSKRNDNAYLVTGNSRHFPLEPFIVTPKEMLEILDEAMPEFST